MNEAPRADLHKVPDEIASMFDSVASRYDMMDALMTGGLNNVWMAALRKAVAPHPGERILDLAAGTGTSSAALAKGGAEVVACDLSEGMIEVGRERHPDIEFVRGNAMSLDFEEASFDPTSRVFRGLYGAYQSTVMPALARVASTNGGAYDYLVESIRQWPSQEEVARMIAANGWREVEYRNLTGGIACLHRAVKPLP